MVEYVRRVTGRRVGEMVGWVQKRTITEMDKTMDGDNIMPLGFQRCENKLKSGSTLASLNNDVARFGDARIARNIFAIEKGVISKNPTGNEKINRLMYDEIIEMRRYLHGKKTKSVSRGEISKG